MAKKRIINKKRLKQKSTDLQAVHFYFIFIYIIFCYLFSICLWVNLKENATLNLQFGNNITVQLHFISNIKIEFKRFETTSKCKQYTHQSK